MAGSKTAYLELALQQHVLGNVPYAPPATFYVALSLAPFDPNSAPDEPVGGAYARIAVTNNLINFPAPSGSNPSVLVNGTDIAYADATADWGEVFSAYLMDASSGGNGLYGGDFTTSVVVTTGPSITIAAGRFVFWEL